VEEETVKSNDSALDFICPNCGKAWGHNMKELRKRKGVCDCNVVILHLTEGPAAQLAHMMNEDVTVKTIPDKDDNVQHPAHYTQGGIEVWDFIQDQGLNYFEGNIVKYVSRWKIKNGLEDLRKAKAYLDKLIKWEEGNGE